MNISTLRLIILIVAFSTNSNRISSFFFFIFLSYTKHFSMSAAKQRKIADERVFQNNGPIRFSLWRKEENRFV